MSISFPIPNRCQDTDSPTHISGSGKFPKRYPLRAEKQKHTSGTDSPAEVSRTRNLGENQCRSFTVMTLCRKAPFIKYYWVLCAERKVLNKSDNLHTWRQPRGCYGHNETRSQQCCSYCRDWPAAYVPDPSLAHLPSPLTVPCNQKPCVT